MELISRFLLILIAAAAILTAWLSSDAPAAGEIFSDRQISASSVELLSPVAAVAPVSNLADPPPIDLESAVAVNLATDFYYLKIGADRRWPIASLTKLLTAVTVLEDIGYQSPIKGLIERMMVVSSNEAAEQLAGLYADRGQFIEKINAEARSLGMAQTGVFDPTGLSFLNQSTAVDLEKLVRYVIKNQPLIFQLSRQPEIIVDGGKLRNINRFAGRSYFMGGKTGYTDEANGNLISIFQLRGQPILIIVLGAANYEERFNQTETLFQWISKSYN